MVAVSQRDLILVQPLGCAASCAVQAVLSGPGSVCSVP